MLCSYQKTIYPKPGVENASGYTVVLYNCEKPVLGPDSSLMYTIKAVGYLLPMASGIQYELHGDWEHNDHGYQFKVDSYDEIVKPTRAGITGYLASGLIKGIGKVTAERIYDAFGDSTLEVLDNDPNKLLSVRGINEKKLMAIKDSYITNRAAKDIVAYLTPFGVTANLAVKIFKEYGAKSIETLQTHPYRLCEMTGIGFKIADSIARKLRLKADSNERVQAGMLYVLREAEGQGHLCLDMEEVYGNTHLLLDTDSVTRGKMERALNGLLKRGTLVEYNGDIYRRIVGQSEDQIAARIYELLSMGPIHFDANLDEEIKKEEKLQGVKLAPKQLEAVRMALTSRFCIITGGPGTGKTMIQRIILNVARRLHPGVRIKCVAPTGRAARRLQQSTKHPASTIHSALNMMADDNEKYSELQTLDADRVLLDEGSMVDIFVARHLFNSLPLDCQLTFIGDADQLPSVGPGAVLRDIIESGEVPVVRLEIGYRANSDSLIASNSALIKHGHTNLDYGEGLGFELIESPDLEKSAQILEDLYAAKVAVNGMDDVVMLSPFRKRTATGVNAMNKRLQARMNPAEWGKPEVVRRKITFRQGDRVMQMRNFKNLSNGDIGTITKIDQIGKEYAIYIDFGDGRSVEYLDSEMEMLDLAFAQTVHKSQGAEYKCVLFNVQMAHYNKRANLLVRPLLYTGITRAQEEVILVGERKAVVIAIRNTSHLLRKTNLAPKIQTLVAGTIAAA